MLFFHTINGEFARLEYMFACYDIRADDIVRHYSMLSHAAIRRFFIYDAAAPPFFAPFSQQLFFTTLR